MVQGFLRHRRLIMGALLALFWALGGGRTGAVSRGPDLLAQHSGRARLFCGSGGAAQSSPDLDAKQAAQ